MVNDWHLTSISQDGVALNMSGITQYLDLRKDGSATLTISINIGGLLVDNSTVGTWEFNDDKSKLVLTETGATVTDDYTILKLTSSELKVQQIDSSNGDITIQTWETM